MLSTSLNHFPSSPSEISDTSIPFGCVAVPLADIDDSAIQTTVDAADIARCESCGAYLNPYCGLHRREWSCNLCGSYSRLNGERYHSNNPRRELDELRESCFEADFAADASASTPPAYIAVVDGSASEEVLELVRAGLHAALKALPNGALFGLISCTDTMTLHLLGGLHTQPHARHIPLPPSGKGEPLALLDAVSIDKLLTRIDDAGRERAAAAIESLRGAVQEEGGDAAPPRCGLGACLRSLADALSGLGSSSLTPPRLLVFLNNRPNYSVGALPPLTKSGGDGGEKEEEDDDDDAASSTAFYSHLSEEYACIGVPIFLYSISSTPIGLSSFATLPSRTGGILNHYSDDEISECTLPEDLYKQLASPFVSQCVLKLRTSNELLVSRCYGPLLEDSSIQQLYYLAGCHEESTCAFGLEFSHSTGFPDEHEVAANLQLVFTYTVLVQEEVEGGWWW